MTELVNLIDVLGKALLAIGAGMSKREHTAIPDYLTKTRVLKERVQGWYGRVQTLCRKVDRIADGAALLHSALSTEA
jgi:hypothetical protein